MNEVNCAYLIFTPARLDVWTEGGTVALLPLSHLLQDRCPLFLKRRGAYQKWKKPSAALLQTSLSIRVNKTDYSISWVSPCTTTTTHHYWFFQLGFIQLNVGGVWYRYARTRLPVGAHHTVHYEKWIQILLLVLTQQKKNKFIWLSLFGFQNRETFTHTNYVWKKGKCNQSRTEGKPG